MSEHMTIDFNKSSVGKTNYPVMPDRLYFSISEASELCLVQPHVLRYWEKQFDTLSPIKRNGRRYFTCKDVFSARQIRELLYVENFTIEGARAQLQSDNEARSVDQNYYNLIKDAIINLKAVLDDLK